VLFTYVVALKQQQLKSSKVSNHLITNDTLCVVQRAKETTGDFPGYGVAEASHFFPSRLVWAY
jgi:hypothetical protein